MDSDLIITVIFGAVAVFVIFKLRSVLGTRTGLEKKREPYAPAGDRTDRDKVVPLPDRRTDTAAAPETRAGIDPSVAALRRADPSFDPEQFLEGAKGAFEMIVAAFAKGDEKALEPLLAPDVYQSFVGAIRQRQEAGEVRESKVIGFRGASIKEAKVENGQARVTVHFTSEQLNVTRDKDGTLLDGDPKNPETVSDQWTFAREVRSRDPNWFLVETASGD